jgi:hypothetical protein
VRFEPDTPVVRRPDVLGEAVGADTVLLELGADRYFRLNGTGSRLWHALGEPVTPRSLALLLSSEHGVGEERALAETESFLRGLAERGLVRPAAS